MASAVYVLIDPPPQSGSQQSGVQAWKLDIPKGDTIEDTIKANAHIFPIGHTILTVSDTKTTKYHTTPALTPVD